MKKEQPNVSKTLKYIDTLDLPPAPRRRRSITETTVNVLDETKKQSMVVGSDILSFAPDVVPEQRNLIANCSLLAQLAANKKVPDRSRIEEWYNVYFDTLNNIGWVTQTHGFSQHVESGKSFETNKAILSVAATVFGPASTALAIVTSTLDSIKSMSEGQWMTIFDRESKSANAARFQVTVGEIGTNGELIISLMAFRFDVKSQLLQILFFKFNSSEVKLWHASGRVAVNNQLLAAISSTIASKVQEYALSFIRALPI